MFVDASAIVAIIAREPEAETLTEALDPARSPITSPPAVYEATLGLCRKKNATVEAAQQQVEDFLLFAGIRIVAIVPDDAGRALEAFARYGKGRRTPGAAQHGGTASPMRWRERTTPRCCSRAPISP